MSMLEHCDKKFVGQRKDGRLFAGNIIDVWSWPSTNPEKGELIIIQQEDQQIKSVLKNNLEWFSIDN